MWLSLISDPDVKVAGASINVFAGSLNEPEELPGLAHFLEHMLFMGTEKYPEENAFMDYLNSNGEETNAWTADYSTNYHFEIG